ncbi:MAG TPA: ribonuclease D [Solirubrobacteraceae bacterium]|jgi:ribonuclease D|nr:ribonuclease D [Solirubrobacteraceae bacterium]
MIKDAGELERLATQARAAKAIAIDTEFMGEGRYRTLLCLIQIAVPLDGRDGGSWIELIDPLQSGLDASPLAQLLVDPEVEVVVHAGRQDIALLRRALSTEVVNVFDTQVAAGFTGLGAQISYDSLLQDTLGLRLAKSASFTRWDKRPLSAEQLAYAREDVVHLLQAANVLKGRLAKLGRLEWALQECAPLARSSDARDPETIFARLPRIASASAAAQGLARDLVQWREETAERQNRPVQGVLPDAALVEIARRSPSSIGELANIRGVTQPIVKRCGAEIIERVRAGDTGEVTPLRPPERSRPPDPADAPIVALAEALARSRAREAGLAYELIASRSDLQAVVAAKRLGETEPEVRLLSGWRRELVGEQVLRLLAGELKLSVTDGCLHVEE